jgi:hypothetical protein
LQADILSSTQLLTNGGAAKTDLLAETTTSV